MCSRSSATATPNGAVRDVMREAPFESERASVQRVLDEMRTTGHHLMLLVDEFGDTSGLVTLEDILELVVGNIRSEMGTTGEPVNVRILGRQFVEGHRGLTELGAELGIDLSAEDAETVAGMLTHHFHHIPRPNGRGHPARLPLDRRRRRRPADSSWSRSVNGSTPAASRRPRADKLTGNAEVAEW